jgi:hypothetical protein
MSDPAPQNTFVVRFWWELGGKESNRPQRWRGRVDHIQSGDAIAFQDVREMLAFLERFVAPLEWQSVSDKEDA